MAFDSLRLTLNSGEARYLKKTVGHALNQCITELIQVRPTDPVEYMGYWLRRYVDSRNYFQKKQLYYKELVAETSNIASMRLAREEHLHEAIETLQVAMNEAERGTEIPTAHKSSFHIEHSSSMSSASRDRIRESKGVTTNAPESPKDEERLPEEDNELDHDSNVPSEKVSRTGSSSHVPIRVGSKISSTRSGSDIKLSRHSLPHSAGGSSTTFTPREEVPNISVNTVQRPKKKNIKDSKVTEAQKKSDPDDNSSNSSSTLADQFRVRHRSGSLEVMVASWKVKNAMIYCYHPLLGMLSPQQQRIETEPVEEWMTKNPAEECFYDHELYLVPKGLGSGQQSKRSASSLGDKSPSDVTQEENRLSLDGSKSPAESGTFLTIQSDDRLKRSLKSISD